MGIHSIQNICVHLPNICKHAMFGQEKNIQQKHDKVGDDDDDDDYQDDADDDDEGHISQTAGNPSARHTHQFWDKIHIMMMMIFVNGEKSVDGFDFEGGQI